IFSFFFSSSAHHRDLHSFPTRRSSDLARCAAGAADAARRRVAAARARARSAHVLIALLRPGDRVRAADAGVAAHSAAGIGVVRRSEEHTSELQSLAYLVCRLLLEKKKY